MKTGRDLSATDDQHSLENHRTSVCDQNHLHRSTIGTASANSVEFHET